MKEQPVSTNPNFIPHRKFDDYKGRYEHIFVLERSPSGVLMARFHQNGGESKWNGPLHRAVSQLCSDVNQDIETEIFIFTGTGEAWLVDMETDPTFDESDSEIRKRGSYEIQYLDGTRLCEGIVNLEVPSIGIINGSGFHTEMALFCDITIMCEDAVIMDPHYFGGAVPGDGIQIAFRTCMGYKRANYALLMGERIDAETALRYGMVNEIVPRDKMYERAWEIGEQLARAPRIARRLTAQILRAPLKQALAWELRHAFGTEMMDYLCGSHEHTAESVKKGNRPSLREYLKKK